MKKYYIYFIFAGYRIAIGKTTNIAGRITNFQRTYLDVQVLGLIECTDNKSLSKKEKETLITFQKDNAFRDMFYLSPQMKKHIVENTTPLTKEILAHDTKRRRGQGKKYKREYGKRPEVKEKQRKYRQKPEVKEKKREYRQRPEVREQQRKYRQRPEVKARRREYQRKYMRRKRAESEST